MSTRSLSLLVPALALAAGCVSPAPPAASSANTASAAGAPAPAAEAPAAAAAPGKPAEAMPPMPPWKHGENIFAGAKLAWVDPYSPAHLKGMMAEKKDHDPALAALYNKIADNGGAEWIGDWTPNVGRYVGKRADMILKTGVLPYFVVYNVPKRDCGQWSAGGSEGADKYKKWIGEFATSLGNRRAAVILEPDSLGLLDKKMADGKACLSEEQKKDRLELLRFAVHTLVSLGNTAVYLDAGHSGWLKPSVDAKLLKEAGIDEADGFALNVSNYKSTSTEITYGKEISKLLGGKHFVIDTSRNGNGPPKCDEAADDENCWCNPPGRALGSPPTASTADPLIDAYLWLKKPAESDGKCNGGPKAGDFFQARALELARNAKF
ncbi:MAG TPA: glycoside hydrolase family 6 protein [Polyangia bacterium]|nr:glycoside hydrolase family 6 protein [Polyangia bacterium]